MARATLASASAQSDSIKGLAQSIAKPAYRRLLTAEPLLRRAVPVLIIAFLVTICVGAGVQVTGIVNDTSPGRREYDPGNPNADAQGYVNLPNVNPVTEMVDLIGSSRGYEANVQAEDTAKQMFTHALDILK